MDDGAFERRMERYRGGIIEWGTNVYRGMARGHKVIDGDGREKRVVIAFRVREKSGLRRIRSVVKEMVSDGNVEDVLEVEVWGGVGERVVDIDGGLHGKM